MTLNNQIITGNGIQGYQKNNKKKYYTCACAHLYLLHIFYIFIFGFEIDLTDHLALPN